MTHIRNLDSILKAGGLMCDRDIVQSSRRHTNIGYGHIKKRRMDTVIPCLDPVTIGECVPFYFCVRSPMLYVIHKQPPELDYQGGQREIIYLAAKIPDVVQNRLTWCFTDSNAAGGFASFYNELDDLSKLDWKAIEKDKWADRDNPDSPGLKERKQAEFLVHRFFPWTLITCIVVYDEEILERVKEILPDEDNKRIGLYVNKDWYYND